MSDQVRIVQFDEPLKRGLLDFARCVHPKEQKLDDRMQWFALNNPLVAAKPELPGLAIVKDNGEMIGQFLMSPFEFRLRRKSYTGYFGYDFFVKEEYRSRGAGALLFVQGVRMYKPFIGVGVTQIVEKISKAAGIQTIGLLKKFIWVRNPVKLGGRLLRNRLDRHAAQQRKPVDEVFFPDSVSVSGLQLHRLTTPPDGLVPSCDDEVIEPLRGSEFLDWRFWRCPWAYAVYHSADPALPLWLVVRRAIYQGMRLLLVVDHRFPSGNLKLMAGLLKSAKRICEDARLDGVVFASTHAVMEGTLKREGFYAAGRPSAVIAYLPGEDFSPTVNAIHLTMADADLDFSFGEAP